MEWNSVHDKLPPHTQVVLGWGKNIGSDLIGFFLCGFDYMTGWLEWPSLMGLEIHQWALIEGPKKEKEHLFNP